MDMDALVDLIRAMAKKCELAERHKDSAEMYKRWYDEECKKVAAYEEKFGPLKD